MREFYSSGDPLFEAGWEATEAADDANDSEVGLLTYLSMISAHQVFRSYTHFPSLAPLLS